MTYPSVHPTRATFYDPGRCWNGYTIFQAKEVGALLIDMNGGEVQLWKELHGMPNRILPGGHLIGSTGERNTAFGSQDVIDLVQVDWDGNIVWCFNRYEFMVLTGQAKSRDGRLPFVASLDWLMGPEKFVHVYAGRYHR